MKITNPFRDLSRFELCLWLSSAAVIILSYALSGGGDVLTMISSLIGVTALIFMAKGYILGQILSILFAVFYGTVSFFYQYYGEMITSFAMVTPIAIASVISWLKHPYKDTKEVKVGKMNGKLWALLAVLTVAVTTAFYFILSALGNTNIVFSTISIATSFIASFLSVLRSPYYALGYVANDIVLIVLWLLATFESISYLPMIFCFVMFLLNDIYAFYNWCRMRKKQSENKE